MGRSPYRTSSSACTRSPQAKEEVEEEINPAQSIGTEKFALLRLDLFAVFLLPSPRLPLDSAD